MANYPYTDPIILTDVLFDAYGGRSANSTKFQRQAAYWMAEEALSEDLDTFLLLTTVTGTVAYNASLQYHKYILPHAWIDRIIQTTWIDYEGNRYFTASGTNNVYVSLENAERGKVDVSNGVWNCKCKYAIYSPYQLEFVYETGFSSGTSYSHNILLALTTYAQVILNEIVGYGNEAPGGIGVENFSNQEYSETRRALKNTVYGDSAKAQLVHRLLRPFRRRREVGA